MSALTSTGGRGTLGVSLKEGDWLACAGELDVCFGS